MSCCVSIVQLHRVLINLRVLESDPRNVHALEYLQCNDLVRHAVLDGCTWMQSIQAQYERLVWHEMDASAERDDLDYGVQYASAQLKEHFDTIVRMRWMVFAAGCASIAMTVPCVVLCWFGRCE